MSDAAVRVALYEAAHVILTRVSAWSSLKAWAMTEAKRRGAKRAKVALARKLSVVLHRMWLDDTNFRFGRPVQAYPPLHQKTIPQLRSIPSPRSPTGRLGGDEGSG